VIFPSPGTGEGEAHATGNSGRPSATCMSKAASKIAVPGVIAHQQHKIDQLVRREQCLEPRKSRRRDLMIAQRLAAEFDDGRVHFAQNHRWTYDT